MILWRRRIYWMEQAIPTNSIMPGLWASGPRAIDRTTGLSVTQSGFQLVSSNFQRQLLFLNGWLLLHVLNDNET